MRTIVFILSLITLIETSIPCCLWDHCSRETTHAPVKHHPVPDDCSSLSACSHCSAGVALAASADLPLPFGSRKDLYGEYRFRGLPSRYSASLWQPPRSSF